MRDLRALARRVLVGSVQLPRVWKYLALSDCRRVDRSRAIISQPTVFVGRGRITLGACRFGVWPSPYFFNGSTHIEARGPGATVTIGDGCWLNNNAVIIAEVESIEIGRDVLIGTEFTAYDSDFHDLHPARRHGGMPVTAPVRIEDNVFIGSRVTVLKGVTIGQNSVIASGAVVVASVPPNTIAAGVPARVIGLVPSDAPAVAAVLATARA